MSLFCAAQDYLRDNPGSPAKSLISLGFASKSDVNAMLYANRDLFESSGDSTPPLWSLCPQTRLPKLEFAIIQYIAKSDSGRTAKDIVLHMSLESTKNVNPILYRLLNKRIIRCDKTCTPPVWK